jgi:hypothetical protein
MAGWTWTGCRPSRPDLPARGALLAAVEKTTMAEAGAAGPEPEANPGRWRMMRAKPLSWACFLSYAPFWRRLGCGKKGGPTGRPGEPWH